MAVEYTTLDANFESCTSVREQIEKINAIINTLLASAATIMAGQFAEYKIDTGQTTQHVVYRTQKEIIDSVANWRKIRQMYYSDLTGHSFKNVDGRNLNGRRSF